MAKTINISIQSLVGAINITCNEKLSAATQAEIKEQVTQALLDAVHDANEIMNKTK